MATYVNNLRLKEITTGDEDGTWGTSTNTNLELITDGFSYGTKEIAADANETFTMPDATADATRSLYLKFTSAVDLTATREITLGPNTVSKTWIIENATSGSQIITIKQGSGATVDVANGSKVMIVTDGAGAGAAVLNANPTEVGGTVTSVGGTGTVNGLTLTGTVTTSGNLTLGGTLANVDLTSQVTGTLPVANGGTGSTTASGALTNLGLTATAAEINTLDGITATTTELNYTDGVTSNIQTQLNAKGVGSVTSVGGTGTVQGLTLSGTVTSSGNLTLGGSLADVDLTSQVTGTLPVANGGTGATTLTANNVLLGNGTSALQEVAPGTCGNVLTSDGTTWTSSAAAAGLTGVTDSATPFLTALGSGAGVNLTGTNNVAIGFRALCGATNTFSNTAVGACSLTSLTSETAGLTAFGFCAMRSVTGAGNAAFGCCALASNSSGTFNVAFGNSALGSASAANSHTAVGHGALRNVVSPIGNTAVGKQASCSTTTGDRNTSVGNDAHRRNSTGSHNVAIGDNALQNGTTGCNNIAIGENAASTTALPAAPLGFNNITTECNRITMGNDSHDCALIKIAWTVVSDCRDKTCFKEVPHGIDFVRALKPTEYQFKKKRDLDEPDGVKRYGFLAQDIMALEGEDPVVASADDPNKLKYNEAHMVPILVNAIKDLADEIEQIKDLIAKM
jgi:hypothetical protein